MATLFNYTSLPFHLTGVSQTEEEHFLSWLENTVYLSHRDICFAGPAQESAGGGGQVKDSKGKRDEENPASNTSGTTDEQTGNQTPSITDPETPLTGDTGNLDIGQTDLGAGAVGAGNEDTGGINIVSEASETDSTDDTDSQV